MVQPLREIINDEQYDEASLIEALFTFEIADIKKVDSDVVRFLREDAIQYEKSGTTRTYLIINDELWSKHKIQIDGYFSIALKVLFFNHVESDFLQEVFGDSNKKTAPHF